MSGNDESTASRSKAYYRQDGVRIGFDPYAPGMAETYGAPGETDIDGFDPYNDTVGTLVRFTSYFMYEAVNTIMLHFNTKLFHLLTLKPYFLFIYRTRDIRRLRETRQKRRHSLRRPIPRP